MSGIDLEDLQHRLGITIYAGTHGILVMISAVPHVAGAFSRGHRMEGLGLADYAGGAIAAGALFQYLFETQKTTTGSYDCH